MAESKATVTDQRCDQPPGHVGWLDCSIHNYEVRKRVDQLLVNVNERPTDERLIEHLQHALAWALEEGGWRLWYYAADGTIPDCIVKGKVGEPARFEWEDERK